MATDFSLRHIAPRSVEKTGSYRVVRANAKDARNLQFETDEDSELVIIHAIDIRNGLRVADVKLWQQEDRGFLLDVYVRRHCEEIEPWWGFLAKRTGLWRPTARDWRGLGIGGRLIDLALTWLRAHQATHVYGQVMKSAVIEQPWLLGWYQRKGFEIREPPSIQNPHVHSLIWKTFWEQVPGTSSQVT